MRSGSSKEYISDDNEAIVFSEYIKNTFQGTCRYEEACKMLIINNSESVS